MAWAGWDKAGGGSGAEPLADPTVEPAAEPAAEVQVAAIWEIMEGRMGEIVDGQRDIVTMLKRHIDDMHLDMKKTQLELRADVMELKGIVRDLQSQMSQRPQVPSAQPVLPPAAAAGQHSTMQAPAATAVQWRSSPAAGKPPPACLPETVLGRGNLVVPPPPPRAGWPPEGLPRPWGVNEFLDPFLLSVCEIERSVLAAVKADPLLAVSEEPGQHMHHVRCLGCNKWYSEDHRTMTSHQNKIPGVLASWDQFGEGLRASSQDPEAEFIRLHVASSY